MNEDNSYADVLNKVISQKYCSGLCSHGQRLRAEEVWQTTESEVINEYAFKTGRGRLLHVVQCAVALQLGAFNNTEGMGVNLPLGTNVNGRLKCGEKPALSPCTIVAAFPQNSPNPTVTASATTTNPDANPTYPTFKPTITWQSRASWHA